MRKMSYFNQISVFLFSSICSYAFAGGYRIPETSLNSSALSSAYIASANGADSSYYNPANMVFNSDKNQFEVSLSYLELSKISYKSSITPLFDASSKAENFLIPNLHYSSKAMGNLRVGLSIITPAGLSKRWDDLFAKASTEEFSLKTIEINPTIGYQVNDVFSFGGGVRFVYANGKVKSDSSDLNRINPGIPSVARNMKGNSLAYGYNLALAYKPNSKLSFGLTYRSRVNLDIEGDAKLYADGILFYDGDASVSLPLPATLDIAVAYTFLHTSTQKTTLEFVYERNYWSSYKNLDFDYDIALPVFDAPIEKKWHDSNTFRFGLTHQYNTKVKFMFGYAKDETPIAYNSLGFELPSADGQIFSAGIEYKLNNTQSMGISYIYNERDNQQVNNTNVNGQFEDANAYMITLAFKQSF